MEITSNNIYQAAQAFATTIMSQLNEQAANTAGIDVMWFRSVPQKRSTDVIFQSYTLQNVEECPIEIKALYTDTSYNDAELQFQLMGIEYKPTLCLEIPTTLWYSATNNDGTMPQQHDIVFVPLTKKLWEVESMTPVMQLGSVTTSFKCNMKTYTPRADRYVGEGLKEAIDNTTVNVDKLYGDDILNELADLTDGKQLDKFSSTVKDKNKTLTKVDVTKSDEIIRHKNVNYTIAENIMIDGHIVARSYYNMNIADDVVVEYKNSEDHILAAEERCLSMWVNQQTAGYTESVSAIKMVDKEGRYANLEISIPNTTSFNIGDKFVMSRNTLALYGEITNVCDDKICVKVQRKLIKVLDNALLNWMSLSGFTINSGNNINILSAVSSAGEISLDLISGRYIVLNVNGTETAIRLQKQLIENHWYGLIINIGETLEVNVFDSIPNIKLITNAAQKLERTDMIVGKYFLKSSNSFITNIRLYNMANRDIDKQLTDLVSYNIKNNSKAIINDSADIYIDNEYFGQQR